MKSPLLPGVPPWTRIVCLIALCCLPLRLPAQVRIHEVLASNQAAVDNADDFPDYIELVNPTSNTVSLAGMRLTDDFLDLNKFVFPPNTFIEPGGYYLVWADSRTNSPGLHTGFGLNDRGDQVYLYNASGFYQDSVVFGLQLTDLSIGRIPDAFGTWVLTVPTPLAPNQEQPIAAPTRLFFNEWAALNEDATGDVEDDWLEIYNATNLPAALGGVLISDTSTNHPIPQLSYIGANEFLELTADDDASNGADHLPFRLSSSNGETLTLWAPGQALILDQVIFGPQQANVSEGRLPDAAPAPYRRFPGPERSPGQSNFKVITHVVINELISHTDFPLEDAFELYNPTADPVDISMWWISDDRDDPFKFRVPAGTVLMPGQYKVFYEYAGIPGGGFNPNGYGTNTSFTFNSAQGDEINLFGATPAGDLDGFRLRETFGPSDNGVSFGRVVTPYDTNFVPMQARTFGVDTPVNLAAFRMGTGLPNAAPRVGPIVVSEIMYHPPDFLVGTNEVDNDLDEYIELHNITDAVQLLYDPLFPTNTWRLRNAVDYEFPMNVFVPARGYLLVVNFDPATNATQLASFLATYNVPGDTPIHGPYRGKLGNGGESIELKWPDTPQGLTSPDFGLVPYVEMERIRYRDEAPWPVEADGMGDALHRLNPDLYGDNADNWAAGRPTPGAGPGQNLPPVLAAIPDMMLKEHHLLMWTNVASDPDGTAEVLHWSLGPGAPPNASISSEGVLRWRPGEDQAPGAHDITVVVTDEGLPALSAMASFQVTVEEVNRAPTLFVHPRYTSVGRPLSFLVGQDLDLPPNPLRFELAGPAPAGVGIDPSAGILSWTPMPGQSPSTNVVRVRLTDGGQPSYVAERDIDIYVRAAGTVIIVAEAVRTDTGVAVRWGADTNRTYQVQYVENIGWLPMGSPQRATNEVMQVMDPVTGARLYRVLQVD